MDRYTEHLEDLGAELSPEDEDYADKLLEIAGAFRRFDEALDSFLVKHGYSGDIHDVDGKFAFLREAFARTGIPALPRNTRKWFTGQTAIRDRTVAFQICFAFRLDVAETNEFFRSVCLTRGFDCHNMEEAVWYYAIRRGLDYRQAKAILDRAPLREVPDRGQGRIAPEGEVLYTETILAELDRFQSEEELLTWQRENVARFGYNNATACKFISAIWERIAGPEGLAYRERVRLQGVDLRADKRRSVWDVLLQILGLDDYDHLDEKRSPLYALPPGRSLKPILQDNRLLHPIAEEAFPDRQGIELVLSGRHVSHERVRKLLILLVFYQFWVRKLLRADDAAWCATGRDADQFHDEVGRYLQDAGYPALYAGNPYDWLFRYCAGDISPLETFRDFMRLLYLNKEDELREKLSTPANPEAGENGVQS